MPHNLPLHVYQLYRFSNWSLLKFLVFNKVVLKLASFLNTQYLIISLISSSGNTTCEQLVSYGWEEEPVTCFKWFSARSECSAAVGVGGSWVVAVGVFMVLV